ncbi:MAG: hybrid sensor histidine kinase/response regulator transcription factor [Bacteroidales bacterium]
MKLRKLNLIVILFSIIASISAQNEKFYTADKEISSNLINHILQDKKGYIWISTEDGLNKFDGRNFSVFQNNPTDNKSIVNNYITITLDDNFNRIWIGTSFGLDIYDQNIEEFIHVNFYEKEKQFYPFINSLLRTSSGDIWIATSDNGICIANPQEINMTIHSNESISKRLGDKNVTYLFEDSKKRIWIATHSNGLFCYIPDKDKLEKIGTKDGEINALKVLQEDSKGNLFGISMMQNIYLLSTDSKEFESVVQSEPHESYKYKCLLSSKQNNQMLIGTDGQGMLKYDYQKKMITKAHLQMTFFDFSKAKIHYMINDSDNNLWLGLFQKGILFQSGNHLGFDYYGYKSIYKNTIGSSAALCVITDEREQIYIGTDSDGLYHIRPDGCLINHYNKENTGDDFPSTIKCVYKDQRGRVWVGSFLEGFGYLDPKSSRYHKVRIENGGDRMIVTDIIEDDSNNIWIGTQEEGIFVIDGVTGKPTQYISENDIRKDALPYNFITCFYKDKNSNIWFGTYRGIGCYNTQTHSFLGENKKSIYGLSDGVLSLHGDSYGNIWAGSIQGLYCCSPDGNITHYTKEAGLPSNTVCAIEEDINGNLWMSTHKGICKFNPNAKSFVNYNISDGIQGNEFWYNASFKDRNGRIYFAGNNGITAFYGQKIQKNKEKTDISLTELYVNGRKVKIGDESGDQVILDRNIADAKSIVLSHEDNTFSIHFSTLEFANPEKTKFEYRLKNVDQNWSNIFTSSNSLTFNSLQPGNYQLEIRAISEDLRETPIKSIAIIITPPWYNTIWAKLLFAFIGVLFVMTIISLHIRYIKQLKEIEDQKKKEEENESRLQFFMNISHELRSPVTLISAPLEKLISENREPQDIFQMMHRNAQRVLTLINQLLDIRKVDKGYMKLSFQKVPMASFIQDNIESFQFLIDKKNIQVELVNTISNQFIHIDNNQFDKVINNLLMNALKYTDPGGRITVKISEIQLNGQPFCQMEIEDTGVGIPEHLIENIFNRFYQIDHPQNTSDIGTGIGLHLCKLLVELHEGYIYAENRTDVPHGSRFVIQLPYKRETDGITPEYSISSLSVPKAFKNDDWTFIEEQQKEKSKSVKRQNILIVEDEMDMKLLISSELERKYNIYTASNGEEGLQVLSNSEIDLIVSDLMMPLMDGFTFCKHVKNNSKTSSIPVILLSGKISMENKVNGLNIGADSYIEKPFNIEVLQSTISSLLRNRNIVKNKIKSDQLINMHTSKTSIKSNQDILLERIMKCINENISNSDLSVELLASSIGLSRAHLYRKIKEFTNLSATELIRETRIKQAEKLLHQNNLSISEVAYSVGFENVNYFSTIFKEYYNISPKEYKAKVNSMKGVKSNSPSNIVHS